MAAALIIIAVLRPDFQDVMSELGKTLSEELKSLILPITNHFSPITSHGRASGLAVAAAFRAARHLDQISGRGFENIGIRIS